jgi:minimal PKS chain-length factor (CLF/KS beta)
MSSAVITGIGVVAPNGFGAAPYWTATLAGRHGIGFNTRFEVSGYPARLAGEVKDFTPEARLPRSLIVQTDRGTQLGLVAAELALADARLDPPAVNEFDMAVVTSSSCGGVEFGQREIQNLWSSGPRTVGPFQSIAWFYAATTGQISIRHGMRGACGVICAEQAGGLEAFAQGRRLIERGDARVAVVGGVESSLSPYGLVAQLTTDQVSRADDPDRAYLPFDAAARGYVPAEGGAILIMEELAHARARGAPHNYGRVTGCAATFDPGGRAHATLRRAVEGALSGAGVAPAGVDVVFADAVAVAELDAVEAAVLAEVFGPGGVPVAAPKALVGRLHAGGAALDVVSALLSIRDGVIPPCGAARPDGRHRIDLVTQARPARVSTALVVARGYGGFNAALVLQGP